MNSVLRNNIIDISVHCAVAIICISMIYLKSSNVNYVFIFLAGSIFIDLDHLVDYFFCCKDKFIPRAFFSNDYHKSGKIYIFLHSWELIMLLSVLGMTFMSVGLFILSAGMAVHLLTDTIMRHKVLPYFLFFRIARKFDVRILL